MIIHIRVFDSPSHVNHLKLVSMLPTVLLEFWVDTLDQSVSFHLGIYSEERQRQTEKTGYKSYEMTYEYDFWFTSDKTVANLVWTRIKMENIFHFCAKTRTKLIFYK